MRKAIGLTALALAGCNAGSQNNQSAAVAEGRADHPEWLVGRWATERNATACDTRIPEIELFADGDAEYQGRSNNWRVEGDRLVLSSTENDIEMISKVRFRRDGDRIRILGGDRRILVRCGTRAAREAARAQIEAARAQSDAANAAASMYDNMTDTNATAPIEDATNGM